MKSIRNLASPVLVLNKSWAAIGTTTVKNAIVAISREAAVGLCVESFQRYTWEEWVSSENPPKATGFIKAAGGREIPAPDAIVLTRYDKLHRKSITFGPRALYRRDEFVCQYCKKRKSVRDLSVDHVLPRSKGGPTTWENCVTSCIDCNQKKADYTLREAGLSLKPKPRRPKWSPVMHISPENRLPSWKMLVKEKD
jgi:5-methylcytosine-specific restriction endonuclease McrA